MKLLHFLRRFADEENILHQFWEKLHNGNVPAMDLLWYFHDEFGDDATYALAEWCVSLIGDEEKRSFASSLVIRDAGASIPHSILLVQHVWRLLLGEQRSRTALLDSLTKQRMELIASGVAPSSSDSLLGAVAH